VDTPGYETQNTVDYLKATFTPRNIIHIRLETQILNMKIVDNFATINVL